ncbi:hypothetical protein SAMN02927914_05976 [Mesorhizobium qingshengii]|uniref:Uncharacterized protein n=1 Tax=Mesorhizobium qingshengii TaxID=1165689 RepID=A0A1G5ZT86_9HYPH|nr:hypothetical protein SAMN02927914_05976 [Mesorhizobium qingshengii]
MERCEGSGGARANTRKSSISDRSACQRFCAAESRAFGANGLGRERSGGQRPQQLGLRLGQIDPVGPILRLKDHNLPIVIRRDIRPGSVVSIVKAGGLLPTASRQRPAMAMNGEPLSVKRCFALGYLVPVNSKNPDAGTRQRLLFPNCRPSERKLNTGPLFGPLGGNPNVIDASSIVSSAARITGPGSLIRMSSARGKSSSVWWVGILSASDAIIRQYSAQATCCS